MKAKILRIIKVYNCTLISYKSERSDMGTQCFDVEYSDESGKYFSFDDGYYVGDGTKGNYIVDDFLKHIQKATNKTPNP